ncbi:hypothetical protein HK097_010952 [Rhizophlyctis rosea]|uniref:Thiaminase-2/PQQC domain-containing protein n=1 Tax=Rhizophlyctis rosea TaxID=64517 RepID=A0AAD5X4X0_9FUNG|nr:hypothetical protein HK097_010952 [Rhizophlyctis rosea]
MAPSITNELLARNAAAYKQAVNHRFLKGVAEQTANESFQAWLSQDLHFVLGYIKILSLTLARVPKEAKPGKAESDLVGFATAIGSITEEFAFFREQAKIHDIPLTYTDDTIGPVTRRYIEYLTKLATEGSYAELLTGVWAAERIYLDSWSYAAESTPLNKTNKWQKFINHWTKPDFVAFVNWLEGLTDEAAGEVSEKVDNVFKAIIQLEVEFWDAAVAAEESK